KILPHAAIILSMMYFVFFCIDRVNSAMAFINNDITKWLLVILGVISIYDAVLLIVGDQKRAERKEGRAQPEDRSARAQNAAPARRTAVRTSYASERRSASSAAPVRRSQSALRYDPDYDYDRSSNYERRDRDYRQYR
ncbi:MAG: hypothetical protein Q4D43_11510, partial [Clostridia bacterium]|nr:hypothetical protein [Clostridia bacterium]